MKKIALSILALATACGASSAAASGTLDPGFGDGGVKTMQLKTVMPWLETFGEEGAVFDVLVDHAGRRVVVGHVAEVAPDGSAAEYKLGLIARYLKTGKPDPTFNGGAPVAQEMGVRGFTFSNVYELPDGRLLVAGMTFDKLAIYQQNLPVLCRFLENGDIDATFGEGGCRTVDTVAQRPALKSIRGRDGGSAFGVQPDGKIVLAGTVRDPDPEQPRSFVVVRLNADGSDDMDFGGLDCLEPAPRCGMAFSPAEMGDAVDPRVVAVDATGRIVVAGVAAFPGFDIVAAVRLASDGMTAEMFDLLDFSEMVGPYPEHVLQGIVALPDGSTILVGSALGSDGAGASVARFTGSGTLDPAFGNEGRVLLKSSSDVAVSGAFAVAAQRDGKLLIAGVDSTPGRSVMRAWRVDSASGERDLHFGTNGMAFLADYDVNKDYSAYGIAVDEREAVIVGSVFTVGGDDNNPSLNPVLMQFELDRLFSDEFDD